MAYQMSQHASRALELLTNARELCVGREQRPLAVDVARACRIHVKSSIPGETPELDALICGIPGKMRGDLEDLFAKAAKFIESADLARHIAALKKGRSKLPDWDSLRHQPV